MYPIPSLFSLCLFGADHCFMMENMYRYIYECVSSLAFVFFGC